MLVIKPNNISLKSSSVAENEAAVWVSTTTYKKNDKVIYEHRVYQSLIDSNVGKKPSETSSGVIAAWQDFGATNMWKMFDDTLSTQTLVEGDGEQKIEISIAFNDATGFALLNLIGVHVSATITEEGETVPYWSKEFNLLNSSTDWFEWFFEERNFIKDLVVINIPSTRRGTLKLILTGANIAGIGHFTHGKQRFIGKTLGGLTPSLRSYSKKEPNEFGDIKLVKRKSAKRFTGELYVIPRNADSVYNVLSELENVIALWIGDDLDTANGGYQSTTVLGWIEEFHEALKDAFDVRVSITIQGLA